MNSNKRMKFGLDNQIFEEHHLRYLPSIELNANLLNCSLQ